MLRVSVSRESATESSPIGEVVIGKFAGTEQRGGYAARVFEPPSQYSNGTDACFTVRGHERYQPAMALVASVLAAWREGRVDEVGEGIRTALVSAAGPADRPDTDGGPSIGDLQTALAEVAAGTGARAEAAHAAGEMLRNIRSLADSLIGPEGGAGAG